jgi:F-type H+-transporting ATPase subunit a
MAAGHTDAFHHVRDASYFELPLGQKIFLPRLFGFELTKFMVLQVVAAVAVFLIFRGLSRRIASGVPAQGRWWNFWEMLAVFIRDEVVRPTIGDGHHGDDDGHGDHGGESHASSHDNNHAHPADKYLPFVWSCFFYVLICNLLGAVPMLGSATAEINVTGALAIAVFGTVIFYGSKELGGVGFWKNLMPGMDMPPVLKIIMTLIIWPIELLGLFIKHGVLAVRLFANIMAGHTVIAAILGFIAVVAGTGLFWPVSIASVFGQVAIGMLELFVAFLQAYIFAFLATLFIGAAVHEH